MSDDCDVRRCWPISHKSDSRCASEASSACVFNVRMFMVSNNMIHHFYRNTDTPETKR